ncbi:MAG TPA: SDR family NAD(P)-dependent oxidoreductase [Chitinophagaceae bacterium]|nr:SDR family NAD(P)-dependent oxidoreductase [Chitinophagaceae bacterium]
MNILITGGASGLGQSITKVLAERKTLNIFFTYNHSADNSKELESQFKNVKAIHCNFENEESLQSLLLEIEKNDIQVLVNNAFTGLQTKYFHKMEANYFADNFNKNIIPVIKITQQAIIHFRKKKFGKIITILSAYIINKPPIGLSEYVAEKNYLLSLSKSWAVENAKFNITSNCISPSIMQTALTANTDERVIEEIVNNHPLKKILSTTEVSETVNYFVNASQQINGINFVINSASDFS